MALLESKIFSYFHVDALNDPNKDVDNKGTLQRYMESIGNDFDVEMLPKIESLLDNVILPTYCQSEYVPLLESTKGNDLFLSSDETTRRAIQRQILRYYEIKGTIYAYNLMFNLIGLTAIITEAFTDGGFDSPTTFDEDLRTFDSHCTTCFRYSIDLARMVGGGELSTEELQAVDSIVFFNEPINAHLTAINFDGTPVNITGDFNNDYNSDYFNT